ncbi:MAG: DUF748 domain-containing protein [Pseudoxanthomonas sp.]
MQLSGGRKRWWGLLALVLAVAAYAALGFWVVPRVARAQAIAWVADRLGKDLTIGELRFNPFTFEVDAGEVAVREHAGDATPLVSLQRLHADFQLASLWRRALVFAQLRLERPYAQVVVRPDGSLNLAGLVPPDDGEPSGPAPEVHIADFQVVDGRLDYADQSLPTQPRTTLAPIAFAVRDFHTRAGGGAFSLQAQSHAGERLDFSGSLSLQPLASQGKFALQALQAASVQAFLGGYLPMELHGGSLDLDGNYRFGDGDGQGVQLDVELPQTRVAGLGLRAKGVDEDWIVLPQATLDDTRVSLAGHRVAIAALRLQGAKVDLRRQADGAINLARMFASTPAAVTAAPAAAPAPAVTPAAAAAAPAAAPAPASTGPDWSFDLAKVQLEAGEVDFQDHSVSPAARFKLAPVTAELGAVGLDLSRPVPLKLQGTIDGATALQLEGSFVPGSGALDLQLALDRLPLKSLLAYLPAYPALQLRAGMVEAKGRLQLAAAGAPGPQLAFDGDAGIAGLDLVEKAGRREFLSWQKLDAYGIAFSLGPDRVAIDRIDLHRPNARVAVAEDGSVNLVEMFAAPRTAGSAPATAASTPPAKPAAVATAKPAAASDAGMPVKLRRLAMDGGTVGFSDYSIEPNFSARIEDLHGSVSGLSTAADAVADIDLAGYVVNKYSPVTIRGGTRPFAYDQHTDLAMDFRNIDLSMFNPYSGRFAGYAIAKGKLTTELHYVIEGRKLQASHHVIVDQLEWGQATDSKDKVSLPIRLATSLLKDRHGTIDLSLPVTGSLDDPQFRIGPIIWKIIGNLITKAVTAPFALLGSLFKGAEEAQFVDFAPGSAELPGSAREHLGELAKSLADRPELRLDIPAAVAPQADADGLAAHRLAAALAVDGKTEQATALEGLPPEAQVKALRAAYRQAFGHKPQPPEPAPAPAGSARAERHALEDQAEADWLRQQLIVHFQPSADELRTLGQARAQAVQDALLSGGELDPARVFIDNAKAASVHEGSARVELGLQ